MSGPEELGTIAWVVGFLAAAYGLFRLWVWVIQGLLRQERPYDEAHVLRAADGARVDVYRYRGSDPDGGCGGRLPVLLCHGIAANRYNLDLFDECSLARAVQQAGFDAWIVELRCGGRRRVAGHSWGFDELWSQDLDVAVRFVLSRSGAPRLHWVGYSMGGMLGYAFLQSDRASMVASFAAIASPATLAHGRRFSAWLRLSALTDWLGGLPLERLGRSIALLGGALPARVVAPLYHPDNRWPRGRRATLGNLLADIPRALMLQFRVWALGDGRIATRLVPDLLGGLAAVGTPSLLVAGAHDGVAPPSSVRAAHEAMRQDERELVIVGRAEGFASDYGHADLVTGTHARAEVFPLVTGWLERQEERLRHG